ncbi:right-handed parallel beta-helix repeat-containing protein [Chitinophaga lutea]
MFKRLLPCLLFAAPAIAQDAHIHVSPSGKNANPGSASQPVATLHAAQRMWRQHFHSVPGAKVTVSLAAGTYYLDSALVLTSQDDPGAGRLLIQSAPGAKAVLSGAQPLALRWKSWKNGIFTAEVPAKVLQMDRLFIGRVPQILARYPNYDSSARYFHGIAADAISPARIKKWKQPQGAIVHALHRAEWGGYHYRITGIDAKGEAILEGGWQNNRQMGLHPERRFVENVLEELDAPHEWYFDSAQHRLYYLPANGQQPPAMVSYAVLKELVVLRGDAMEKPLRNVRLEGLAFAATARTFMLTAEPLLRSDWTIYRGGTVLLENTEDCAVKACFFDQPGGNAVFISNYNKNARVEECHIYKAGASGVAIVGNPSAVRSPAFEYNGFVPYNQMDMRPGWANKNFPNDCQILDNLIQYTGDVEKQSAGVQVSIAYRTYIAHNTIHDVPRAGINVGDGCFGGTAISHNDVYNTVLETGDHGAFNSWGRDRFWHPDRKTMDSMTTVHPQMYLLDTDWGNSIVHNRFHCDHGWDIDLDDGSSFYHIYNNLCLSGGIKLREGFARKVESNIMVNNTFHPHVWFRNSGDIFRNNIVMQAYKPIRVPVWGKEVDYNFFPDEASLKAAQANGTDAHSTYGDPLFIDYQHGDYGLQKGSKAFDIKFSEFRTDNFGTRIPGLKKLAAPCPLPQTIKISTAPLTAAEQWGEATLKNIETLGERSATGLPDNNGAYFAQVPRPSRAYNAGFRSGDVALRLDGKPVKNTRDFLTLIRQLKGKEVKVTVFRNQAETEWNFRN